VDRWWARRKKRLAHSTQLTPIDDNGEHTMEQGSFARDSLPDVPTPIIW